MRQLVLWDINTDKINMEVSALRAIIKFANNPIWYYTF